jgi:hypothetical protein
VKRVRGPAWAVAAIMALVLLAAVPLAWLLHGYVRDRLILPASYLIWLARRFLESLDQEVLLALVVIAGAINLLLLLSRYYEPPAAGTAPTTVRGRVSAWLDLLPLAAQKGFVGQMPIRQLSLLLVNVLAQREQWPRAEIWAQLRAGTLPLPREIQAYLQTGDSQREKRVAVDPADRHGRDKYLTQETEALVQFLEDYMKPPAAEEGHGHR